MNRLKLDQDCLGLSQMMETIARVQVKDCFRDEDEGTIYFVVETGQLGKALGKGGVNVKRLQQNLGKRIRVIEYRSALPDFIKSIIYPIQVEEIIEENHQVIIKDSNRKTKSLLIGRGGRNLKLIARAVKRFFNIEEIKIV